MSPQRAPRARGPRTQQPATETKKTLGLSGLGWALVSAVIIVSAAFAWTVTDEHGADTHGQRHASATSDRPTHKAEFLAIADRIQDSTNPFMGRGTFDTLTALVARGADPGKLSEARRALALECLRLGHLDQALEHIDSALADETPKAPEVSAELHRVRALVHLRRAEVENCVERHNRQCCIFPLQGDALHSVREPALHAKQDYLAYLELMRSLPDDAARRDRILSAIWLLNVTCMALDEYPDGVPGPYRIPPSAFESEHDIGRFVDVAPRLGLDSFDHAGGAIVDDFDGDGLLDVVSSTCDLRGPIKAFRNAGDGTFADVASAWRLDDQLGGLNIVGVDHDNDGRLDIYVPRGAWMFDDGRIRGSLLRNGADGAFSDVTARAGLLQPVAPTQTAAWADFDNDGWLDVYIGHESRVETEADGPSYPSTLFRNNGDGTFSDVTHKAGVINDRYCKAAAAGDYDNDGDMDIYVSNIGHNRLYRNNGNMTFTDVAPELGLTRPEGRSFATWFFDFDNDADLDIWVGAYTATISDLAAEYLGRRGTPHRPCLYRNNGDGTFTDVAAQVGLDRVFLPMGANFGDLDNDGWLDMYLGTGDPSYETLMPNVALRNDRGRRFQDVTQSSGLGHLQKGHGTAFADVDNDGDQDIFHQLGAFYPGDAFRNALFLNPGHGNRFVTLELVGVQTNRMAVGARIKVVVDTPEGPRELHRAAGCVSSFGGSPRRQEIGLAQATAIRSVETWWPTSGIRQSFRDVPLDSFVRITEGREELELLHPARIDLGAEQ